MAKISTYVTDSNITGGDMLIGTDVDNSNATKNFTVSSLIAYAATNNLVPYTGATGNVNLGSNSLIVGNDVTVGDDVTIAGDLSVTGPTVLGSTLSVGFGATLLGGTLGVSGVTTLSNDLNVTGISTLNNDLNVTGTTNLSDTNINGDIDFNGLFLIAGSEGAAGDVLTSLGAGNPPQWTNPFSGYVPYLGATSSLNLGANDITAFGVNTTGPLSCNGNAGTINQILVSQGVGTFPAWQTAPYTYVEYASFYSTQTQQMVPSDGPTPWTYNNTDISNANITIANNLLGNPTRITSVLGGTYNIQFSAQLHKTGGTDHKASIWFRKNGVDIANSNTNITMKANSNYVVASWNFFVTLTAGQYAEIMWVQDGNIELLYEPADVVVPHPATPSVILTVQRISIIP